MISVEEALELLVRRGKVLSTEIIPLAECLGRMVGEDVFSPIQMPSFNQSAMDGYAVNLVEGMSSYKLIGEVAAGSSFHPNLKEGEAVRIFTGAMVPNTATAIVQQEWTIKEEDKINLLKPVELGKNIRKTGEQIQAGAIALEKGDFINPAAIGFLAGLGFTEVEVIKQPEIAIITTGNELVKPGNPLELGQIYESNSVMLSAALNQFGFYKHIILTVEDDFEYTKSLIKETLGKVDFLILTGGISVGDYDFVGKALNDLGVEELFYKINQKPGKPIYFGQSGSKLIAALPGNPAAALTCFYQYVLPSLNLMMGKGFRGLEEVFMPISESYEKKGERAEFLKAFINEKEVQVLGSQSSAMLNSYSKANALIYIPASTARVHKFELVKVLKF